MQTGTVVYHCIPTTCQTQKTTNPAKHRRFRQVITSGHRTCHPLSENLNSVFFEESSVRFPLYLPRGRCFSTFPRKSDFRFWRLKAQTDEGPTEKDPFLDSSSVSSNPTQNGSSQPSNPPLNGPANSPNPLPKSSAKPPIKDSVVFMMRLPFLYASTLASTNDHYLEQRNRSKWWSRGQFPKVAEHTLRDAILDENVNHPFRLFVKMVPLGIIFFCASFNLSILQNLKDALVVSTMGPESLPFLAAFGVLPASFLFFGFYHTMLNLLPHRMVFYVTVLPLLALYILFVTVMYPASNWLHLKGFFEATSSFVPLGCHGLLKCIENWTYSLFFCVAELWGAIVISVLFWSLANDTCSVKEAKTIYPLMGISANIALVFAGKITKWVTQTIGVESTLAGYRYLTSIIVLSSCFMMAAKFFIDKMIPHQQVSELPSSKKKRSFKDSLAVLKESPKILNLALLVIGYSVSHRFFELVWKGQLNLVYPTAQEYQSVLADVSVWTGMTTITMMIAGKFVFQYLGWGVAASCPPVIMLVTGSVFFLSFFALQNGASMAIAKIGVLAGNITQVAARSAKFSLFDPAKEMVYIETSKEEKSKGKAAVDLVGSQLGKTGASWVSQALLLGFGSISAAMPVFGFLYVGVLVVWLFAVKRLRRLLEETEEERKLLSLSKKSSHEGNRLPSQNGTGLSRSSTSDGIHSNKNGKPMDIASKRNLGLGLNS